MCSRSRADRRSTSPTAIRSSTTCSRSRARRRSTSAAIRSGQSAQPRRSRKPGLVKVYCHIHSHMSATILVLDHPYFVIPISTARSRCANVPAGDYTIVGWHERVGERTGLGSRRARAERTTSICRCRSRTRSDRPSAAAAAGQDADRHLRHGRRCCSSSSSSSSRSASAIRCASPSRPTSNPASGCSRRSKRRRQRELRAQAATLAENPTLKAAIDTYAAEARTTAPPARRELLTTIDRELDKVAARVEADAIVLVDAHQIALAAAGRLADRWPRGRPVVVAGRRRPRATSTASRASATRSSASSPFRCSARRRGDRHALRGDEPRPAYAQELARLAGTQIAIVSDGLLLASTLRRAPAREFESRGRRGAAGRRHDRARRRIARVPAAGRRSATRRSTRSARSTNRRAAAMRSAMRAAGIIARRRDRARAARQLLAGADAERADRPAVGVAAAMAASHDVARAAAADGIEPRARHADRDVQRVDGLGRGGGGADAGGVHRRDPRAGDGARRARSVHRRPLRARQRAVGRHRPRARACRADDVEVSGSARCCTTSARSACPTTCCGSRAR